MKPARPALTPPVLCFQVDGTTSGTNVTSKGAVEFVGIGVDGEPDETSEDPTPAPKLVTFSIGGQVVAAARVLIRTWSPAALWRREMARDAEAAKIVAHDAPDTDFKLATEAHADHGPNTDHWGESLLGALGAVAALAAFWGAAHAWAAYAERRREAVGAGYTPAEREELRAQRGLSRSAQKARQDDIRREGAAEQRPQLAGLSKRAKRFVLGAT